MNKHISLVGVFLLTVIALSTSLFFNACKKDKNCPAGYEGSDCNIESRSKFFGTWKGMTDCGFGSSTDTYSITAASGGVDKIFIDELVSCPSKASVNGSTFMITNDDCNDDDTINGTGSISADGQTIQINWTDDDIHSNHLSCTGTWTKQ